MYNVSISFACFLHPSTLFVEEVDCGCRISVPNSVSELPLLLDSSFILCWVIAMSAVAEQAYSATDMITTRAEKKNTSAIVETSLLQLIGR